MKKFRFKEFELQQDQQVFGIGTDAVLLGCFCDVANAENALEIGSGTGIISLMLAQRNKKLQILAIEIDENAAKISKINFENSVFSKRLKVRSCDFKNFNSDIKFDLIFSNPPYFETTSTIGKHATARHQIELGYIDLISKTKKLLNENAKFTCIIPYLDIDKFEKIANENQLFLQNKILIKGLANLDYKRSILEFGQNKNISPLISEFIIEKSPRQYSEAYLALTKDFHVFGFSKD